MGKKELLAQASSNDFGLNLYIDNKSMGEKREEPKKEVVSKPKVVEPLKETTTPKVSKNVVVNNKVDSIPTDEEEKEPTRMISFRLPESLFEKLKKYSYVARESKTDVVISALEKILDSKEGKELISQYDDIKKKKK